MPPVDSISPPPLPAFDKIALAYDRVLSRIPLVRLLGDHVLLEFEKR